MKRKAVEAEDTSFLKVLGNWDVLALGFGAMIGFGWVVLTGDWIGSAGTLGAVLAMAAGGVIMAVVGLTYAELTAAMPKAGGEHNSCSGGWGRDGRSSDPGASSADT
ncbi:MAG: amino acid permease [Mycobacterium sp.]